MLEIKNINKYFNKGKKNELHVINNTSISLEDNGLVALLGPSGCGKTTLLNTIGGLDKIKNGSIYINDQKISSRMMNKVDKIRNLNVGYIFQDYKLIDNLSVYDNVALVLTMIGLKDKKEIKKRVEYVLDKVGMLRYRKRPAGMLSGGERQRVGIARAIVKDPNIILADEPTGNLDSKNSLEIMKIIKAISKDRLVILVTHEQSLAKFYASRIIEIQDGKIIKDYLNDHTDELDYEIENRFYLKDFKQTKKLDNNIKIYSDDDKKLDLEIVVKGDNIYIKGNKKIEVVDENSSIEFINDHYKKIAKEDIEQYQFDFKNIINDNFKKKYSSILNPFTFLIKGFKSLFNFPILKKILLIGFFLSGMFIMYSVSTIGATLNIKDEQFISINKEYLSITSNKVKIDDYLSYEKLDHIKYLLPGNSIVNFNVRYDNYYQTSDIRDTLKGSLSTIDMITKDDLIYGNMPTNDYEIVVDKFAIQKMFDERQLAQMAGIVKIEDMIGKQVSINYMDPFTIVGIVDKKSPSIYASSNNFINIIANSTEEEREVSHNDSSLLDYKLYENKIELKSGRMPTNDYEVIVNISNKESMPLNKQINTSVGDHKLTVVGYYDNKYHDNYYLVSNNTIKYNTILTKANITVYSSDKEVSLEEFRNLNLNVNDSYDKSKDEYIKSMRDRIKTTLIFSGIILIISLIEIFLMIRSSFLSRIKEIGIYRAIGVKKMDIYKMFFSEIFAITTVASIPGLILMAYILNTLTGIKYLANTFLVTPVIIIISIIFVYLFNLIIGLIPVFNTIKKRPAEILARYDLD